MRDRYWGQIPVLWGGGISALEVHQWAFQEVTQRQIRPCLVRRWGSHEGNWNERFHSAVCYCHTCEWENLCIVIHALQRWKQRELVHFHGGHPISIPPPIWQVNSTLSSHHFLRSWSCEPQCVPASSKCGTFPLCVAPCTVSCPQHKLYATTRQTPIMSSLPRATHVCNFCLSMLVSTQDIIGVSPNRLSTCQWYWVHAKSIWAPPNMHWSNENLCAHDACTHDGHQWQYDTMCRNIKQYPTKELAGNPSVTNHLCFWKAVVSQPVLMVLQWCGCCNGMQWPHISFFSIFCRRQPRRSSNSHGCGSTWSFWCSVWHECS